MEIHSTAHKTASPPVPTERAHTVIVLDPDTDPPKVSPSDGPAGNLLELIRLELAGGVELVMWKVDAENLVERLGLESSIWKGLVRFPHEPAKGTTIGSSSMVTSVKGLLRDPFFGQLPTESQANILNAYWSGIQQVLPEAFENPTEHAIQKGVGAMVLHGVFLQALAVVTTRNESPLDSRAYADVMREALEILEDVTTEGDVVKGAGFWRAGPTGAAGSFSSSAGRRVLRSRILHALPAPEVMRL